MREHALKLTALAGLACVIAGAWWIWPPAGLVVTGLSVIAVALGST